MNTLMICALYFWILSLYFNCFFTQKNFSTFKKIIIWSFFFLIQLVGLTHLNHLITTFLFNCILIIVLCFSLYCGSPKRIIFIATTGCVTGMLTEIFVAIAFQLVGFFPNDIGFVGTIISRIILLALVHAINIFKFQHSYNNPSSFYWVLLLLMTLASIIIIHTLYLFNQNTSQANYINLSTLAIFLLFFMNIAFFLLYNKLSFTSDLQIKNLMMSHQLKHYEELRSNKKAQADYLQREKHNLKNQLIAIRAYAQQGQNSQIINFVNKLMNNSDFGLANTTICNNILIDTLVDSKINIAKEHSISYTWDLNVPSQLPFDDIDLCTLIGNAIDNAFDACLLDNTAEKFVNITIHYKNECLYCHFKNSYVHKLIASPQKHFLTTKPRTKQHGYGLTSIQYVANKYHGLFETDVENNIFSLKVLLHQH